MDTEECNSPVSQVRARSLDANLAYHGSVKRRLFEPDGCRVFMPHGLRPFRELGIVEIESARTAADRETKTKGGQ
jgi:hypothetical protein